MLLIGSRAMGYWNPEFLKNRKVIDWDFICNKEDFKHMVREISKLNKLIELSFPEGTNKAIAKFIDAASNKMQVIDASLTDVLGSTRDSDIEIHQLMHLVAPIEIMGLPFVCAIASKNLLYMLKYSHRFKKNSVHFNKTRTDLIAMANCGAYLEEAHKGMLALREKLTYTNSLPKLNVDKKSFFTDSVPYKYDHDTIHEAVKHLDKPAYQYYMKDGEQVMTSKYKFENLPEIVKLYGVLEESYVLALERAIIPHDTEPKRAFDIALEKVCTSITSGWFREFAYNNYDHVQQLYHESFVAKFGNALAKGQIQLYNAK